jgi:hypothetical protein
MCGTSPQVHILQGIHGIQERETKEMVLMVEKEATQRLKWEKEMELEMKAMVTMVQEQELEQPESILEVEEVVEVVMDTVERMEV